MRILQTNEFIQMIIYCHNEFIKTILVEII